MAVELKDETLMELLDRERETGRLLAESARIDTLITQTLEEAIRRGSNLEYVTVYVKDLIVATGYVAPWRIEKEIEERLEKREAET